MSTTLNTPSDTQSVSVTVISGPNFQYGNQTFDQLIDTFGGGNAATTVAVTVTNESGGSVLVTVNNVPFTLSTSGVNQSHTWTLAIPAKPQSGTAANDYPMNAYSINGSHDPTFAVQRMSTGDGALM